MPYIQKTNPNPEPLKFVPDPDPGLYGLQRTSRHQKYENKKESLQNYLEFSFNSIPNISYRALGVQNPGSEILPKPDPHPCFKHPADWALNPITKLKSNLYWPG